MLRVVLLFLMLGYSVGLYAATSNAVAGSIRQESNFYTLVTELLQRYVVNGKVKYKALQKDRPALDKLAKAIAGHDLREAAPAAIKAFYINAYNVLVLKQVADHYPIKSVRDVPGFFDRQKYKVAGESLTLNELEHKKLLIPFKDARIHFALVCAAKSCPPLLNKAYTPQQVERQLENQARQTLQSPSFIKVLPKQKQVLVSQLFEWYEADFLVEALGIIAYLNKYRSELIPQKYKVGYYTYDWSLNESIN